MNEFVWCEMGILNKKLNCLLLYREVKGLLLYQGFPRQILPTKHPDRNVQFFISRKISCTQF